MFLCLKDNRKNGHALRHTTNIATRCTNMQAALRDIKRALASPKHARIPTRVSITSTSPAANTSANWTYCHTATLPSVPTVIAATTWRACDVWKAARKGSLCVEAQFLFPHDNTWMSVIEWLDGLRAHWQRLSCIVSTRSGTPRTLEWTPQAFPNLTLSDVCARIEAVAFGGEQTHSTATTWAFVVEAPNIGYINTASSMTESWWSVARFGAIPPQMDMRNDPTLTVYPLDPAILADPLMLREMGLEGNRRAHRDRVRAEAAATLREEQDAAYHASLAADQARKNSAHVVTQDTNVIRDDECKMEEDDVDSDTELTTTLRTQTPSPPPLTPAQLREARMRHFQPQTPS